MRPRQSAKEGTMKNECDYCKGKFGLVIYYYRRRRFCSLKCIEAWTREADERLMKLLGFC
jgi:predicted nucleic acid binding AN1-type Zn finger protein